MPRGARVKSFDSIYHIMVKSIVEAPLFKENADKDLYLKLLKKYQELYDFKLYAYCLMNNHGHFIIDANGADISKIMHGINLSYAIAYNKKYKRIGSLFHDRFKSKIVKNIKYIMTLSAYIHNNPVDIDKYKKCPSKYEYSSLSNYLGIKKDLYKILDEGFIMQMFGKNRTAARIKYNNLVAYCRSDATNEDIEFKDEKAEYRSERKILIRNFQDKDIINYVTKLADINPERIYIKYCRSALEAKALIIVLMRNLCNYKCKDICNVIGNITQSRVSRLTTIGISAMDKNNKYKNIISSFVGQFSV